MIANSISPASSSCAKSIGSARLHAKPEIRMILRNTGAANRRRLPNFVRNRPGMPAIPSCIDRALSKDGPSENGIPRLARSLPYHRWSEQRCAGRFRSFTCKTASRLQALFFRAGWEILRLLRSFANGAVIRDRQEMRRMGVSSTLITLGYAS